MARCSITDASHNFSDLDQLSNVEGEPLNAASAAYESCLQKESDKMEERFNERQFPKAVALFVKAKGERVKAEENAKIHISAASLKAFSHMEDLGRQIASRIQDELSSHIEVAAFLRRNSRSCIPNAHSLLLASSAHCPHAGTWPTNCISSPRRDRGRPLCILQFLRVPC
jgi:hypothetical protein